MGLPLADSILPRPQPKFVCSSLGYSKSSEAGETDYKLSWLISVESRFFSATAYVHVGDV